MKVVQVDKEFDTAKGAFWLVAIVIATMMIVVLVSIASCAVVFLSGLATGVCVPLQDFAKELIQMSFTAAIAFAGGRLSAPQPTTPRLPEKTKGEHDNG